MAKIDIVDELPINEAYEKILSIFEDGIKCFFSKKEALMCSKMCVWVDLHIFNEIPYASFWVVEDID